MNRLTDDRTAAALKENIEKLKAAGIEVDASNERYVSLAELERQTEWISVEDRMPEEDVRVIVCSSIKTIGIAYQINGLWFTRDLMMSSPCNKITHWMPLPEPPNVSEDKTYDNRENLLCWSEQGLYPDGFGGARVGYTCPYCKKYVPYAGKYCGKCGERVLGGDE